MTDTIKTNADELPMGATIFTGAGSPELVVGLGEPSETEGIRVDLLDVGGMPRSRVVPVDDIYITDDVFRAPTYEQSQELLRSPFVEGRAGERIYAFGEEVKPGEGIRYRTYCNDPTYAEIKIRRLDGSVAGIFTESWDRVMGRDRTGRRIRRSDQLGSGETGSTTRGDTT